MPAQLLLRHVQPRGRDVERVELRAAEADIGDAPCRHRDDAVDPALRIDAEHAGAFPARAPQEALGIDGGAIGIAVVPAVVEHAAVGDGPRGEVEVIGPDHLVARVGEVEDAVVGRPAGAVGDADVAFHDGGRAVGVDAVEQARVGGDRQVGAEVADIVHHGAEPEPAHGIAGPVIAAIAGKVRADAGSWGQRAGCGIENVQAAVRPHQDGAIPPPGHGGDHFGELPAAMRAASHMQAVDGGGHDEVEPPQALRGGVPETALAELVLAVHEAGHGDFGDRHVFASRGQVSEIL